MVSEPIIVCQLQNAFLELGRRCISAYIGGDERHEYHIMDDDFGLEQVAASLQAAANEEYWRERLATYAPPFESGAASLGPPEAVVAYVSRRHRPSSTDKDSRVKLSSKPVSPVAYCQVCRMPAEPDSNLLSVTCSSQHTAPLCQRYLIPLGLEPHLLCGFCGRVTLAMGGASLNDEAGICAFCGAVVSHVIAGDP
eukprot:TRINITY_DN8432_c0_g1_i2.p1 TRINITY_DN8432_c0_g1~~TRINITY_DN8432_c0_g1_i2.p1  ORF type:complete len:221 (-),score=31.56 TRINITY_DN8432_c0_g1_i2:834-1421(-)